MTDDLVQPIRTTRLSLSLQAQHYLLSLIENGSYEPGEQLPSESQLAARLGISRPTLREALLTLEQEGKIVRRHGVGTFVGADPVARLESGLERLESILELADRQGLQGALTVRDLEVERKAADADLARRVGVAKDTPLTFVHRIIAVNDVAVAYLIDAVPSALLSPDELNDTFQGSVLDLLRQKPDIRVAHAVANIVAVNADPLLAEKLAVEARRALVLLEETLYDAQGAAFEFSRNYFRPEFFAFRVVRR